MKPIRVLRVFFLAMKILHTLCYKKGVGKMKISSAGLFFFSFLIFISLAMAVEVANRKTGPSNQHMNQQSGGKDAEISEKLFFRARWPEVVGLKGDVAVKVIKADMPWAHVVVVPPNTHVTTDFDPFRIRVFVDYNGVVIYVPVLG